jgi:hypothetical protein
VALLRNSMWPYLMGRPYVSAGAPADLGKPRGRVSHETRQPLRPSRNLTGQRSRRGEAAAPSPPDCARLPGCVRAASYQRGTVLRNGFELRASGFHGMFGQTAHVAQLRPRPDHDALIPVITMPVLSITIDWSEGHKCSDLPCPSRDGVDNYDNSPSRHLRHVPPVVKYHRAATLTIALGLLVVT